MTKYTLKQDQTHGQVLCKDGRECICPFQPAIPTQSNLGGIAIMRMPCTTSCPHAEHVQYNTADGENNNIHITCTGVEVILEIETEIESPLKLV